jgi:hypothetical protein
MPDGLESRSLIAGLVVGRGVGALVAFFALGGAGPQPDGTGAALPAEPSVDETAPQPELGAADATAPRKRGGEPGEMDGIVRNPLGTPVANAMVELDSSGLFDKTDKNGRYGFGPGLTGYRCARLISAGAPVDSGCATFGGGLGTVRIDLDFP